MTTRTHNFFVLKPTEVSDLVDVLSTMIGTATTHHAVAYAERLEALRRKLRAEPDGMLEGEHHHGNCPSCGTYVSEGLHPFEG